MRLRLKTSLGNSIHQVDENSTIESLLIEIRNTQNLNAVGIKKGFPPVSVGGGTFKQAGIIDGDSLQIVEGAGKVEQELVGTEPIVNCKNGVITVRIMEDDNSCLFRAIGYALMPGFDSVTELRSVVATSIQDNEFYSDAILGKPVNEYCRWITKPASWGGAIEINLLANHFDVEICSVDISTGRLDYFNSGKNMRVYVIYSGIHYDVVVWNPGTLMHEDDTAIFEANDEEILDSVHSIAKILKEKHYYTDTATFSVECKICGLKLVGEREAEKHAMATGHASFGELL